MGIPVFFDGTGSRPGNGGNIVNYEWRFGDGSIDSGAAVQHIYSNPGGFEVVLMVTDESGRSKMVDTKHVVPARGAACHKQRQ